ncbi:MAG: hypothetical protein KIT84_09555 [Labilithrix sp.]|nr:hypothetical protein [Labilithrix sp.]MCW5811246.1 hypothetical protein [Labilithrix sp.]
MKHASLVNVALLSVMLAGSLLACTEVTATNGRSRTNRDEEDATAKPGSSSGSSSGDVPDTPGPGPDGPGTTEIPDCSSYVDAAKSGNGSAESPYGSIAEAVAASSNGEIICVAEGTYSEKINAGAKAFTLAGGFESGKDFKVRDSAQYVSKAEGGGSGTFVNIEGTGLVAIDGFDVSGYGQAIVRQVNSVGQVEITNNVIHDNECPSGGGRVLVGAGFSLANVKATVKGNVFRNNTCGRGGAGALTDSSKQSDFTLANNLIDKNTGDEPESSHGGAIYLFGSAVTVTNNLFTNNSVTGWGGGLFVGSDPTIGQKTVATLTWNVYRSNKAGTNGGGLFCDDGATCNSDHEIFDKNCGGNVYVDSAYNGGTATIGKFDHMTNVNGLEVGCSGEGYGWKSDRDNTSPDAYEIKNSIFFGNADGQDIVAGCSSSCGSVKLNISYSMVDTNYVQAGLRANFGSGNVAPADPLFVDPAQGDFHLKPNSPARGKGDDGKELGAYGGVSD